jgi:hypothetical protein
MKYIFLPLLASVFSFNAGAATKDFTGKCAKAVADTVFMTMAKTQDPNQNPLEIDVVSSKVNPKNPSVYTVRWGEFDGNQGVIYLSTVKVTADCKLDGKIESKAVGGYDGV